MKASTINRKAVEVLANGNVTARVKELRKKTEDEAILNILERKTILSDIVKAGDTKEVLKAIDLLNKMDGIYTKKYEHTAEIITIKSSLKDFYDEVS
jgi:predicted RecB family nuclease